MSSPVMPSTESLHSVNYTERPDRAFLSFLVDQLTKVEEQNEWLKAKVIQLEKEQEEFYLDGQKRMEVGFRNVAKCVDEVSAMKEVFKEIVGIMSGERIRFVDNARQNVTSEEAHRVSSSTLLANNSSRERQERRQQYENDCVALNRDSSVKTEDSVNIPRALQDEDESDAREGSQDANLSQMANYKINRAIQSVHDVAREYFEGLPNRPSLMSLERRYGSTWRRSSKERTIFAKRMCIINKINDVRQNPSHYGLPENINRNMAIKVVENIRLGNNNFKGHHCRLSLSQLYTYFSKKMDCSDDYSLSLKNRGEPRRIYLMREREARLERGNGEEEVVISKSSTEVE
ncbi:uncharacterized protein ZBIST_0858 [Zygosaccharomyces bailii]|uniref:ZYBA0S03-06634g1_1 n=1 Tax=Zygosaccharomyces bailii (strain CLIB 213 / ATCC 58445 / CBS 680 / BCRC 21525 / NBRC 1098 / NCYC 1416 / NRRL Y-2227) TaxID=1333698 RepID=A0A8J2X7B6_ZYGB2|nr:ZYBA0S03-06634g1_1 [Zygosaccharomyces bailii CLIB 213]CDH16076.1 uncharacterized protein ZBAI_07864 [Zygosaccharomyces bailii ISA1307]SJM83131.1 uncharacterized protein ZBIST_0858 [Zygosaccharomyces bailii]